MKSRADIIKAQESIGNVEISWNQYLDFRNEHEFEVCMSAEPNLYFAPREVVYPDEKIGCGVKIMSVNGKDIKCGEFALGKIRYCNHCHECQKKQDANKIFEDVINICDEELKNLNHNVDECECCEKLKDFIYKIKEKWGKIKR